MGHNHAPLVPVLLVLLFLTFERADQIRCSLRVNSASVDEMFRTTYERGQGLIKLDPARNNGTTEKSRSKIIT